MNSNVLLIVVDSLRADKFYDSQKTAITPNIDSLIKQGFIFTNAISSSDSTYSALGSLFSGTYPYNHQVSWLKNHSNITKNFQNIKNNNFNLYGTFQNQKFFQTISSAFDDVDLVDGEPYMRLFEGLGNKILQKLELLKNKEPWFYYIHLMDFHISKKLPDEYNLDEFGKTTWDKRLHILDLWIGKILKKIDLDKTIVIITSDHGEFDIDLDLDYGAMPKLQKLLKLFKSITPKTLEPLGVKLFVFLRETKRKYLKNKALEKLNDENKIRRLSTRGNSPLFDDVLKIPFLMFGSNIPHGFSNQQVRQIDILPTINDFLGLKIDNKIDGISLKSFLEHNEIPELNAYVENSPNPTSNNELGSFIGLRTSKFKFIRSRDKSEKTTLLYDLKNDPDEKINIAHENPDIVQQMEHLLIKHSKNGINSSTEYDDDEISKIKEELKKMGYI